jgi:uncharacterized protein
MRHPAAGFDLPLAHGRSGMPGPPSVKRIRMALFACLILWACDLVYKSIRHISYANRESCLLYANLPRIGFLILEYFVETGILVFLGTFLAVLAGRWFPRLVRYLPSNPATAFLYGAFFPICSCAAIPLVSSLEGRMKFRTTMAFVLTAPLLSPYVLFLSFTVLGPRYGILRIVSSFCLVMISASVLGWARTGEGGAPAGPAVGCARACAAAGEDLYLAAYRLFRRILPSLLIASVLGILLESLGPRASLINGGVGKGLPGILALILIGVPLYFCNGSEVLFLRPLIHHGLPVGSAVAFSLTATGICTASVALFWRCIGPRLTALLMVCVVGTAVSLALLMNALW